MVGDPQLSTFHHLLRITKASCLLCMINQSLQESYVIFLQCREGRKYKTWKISMACEMEKETAHLLILNQTPALKAKLTKLGSRNSEGIFF